MSICRAHWTIKGRRSNPNSGKRNALTHGHSLSADGHGEGPGLVGRVHWPVGVTLELDLHSVGPGTSKTHAGILLMFLPVAISSGVCCNQPRVPVGGQCVGSLWLRRFVSLTFLLERIPCLSSREKPLCSVSHSILVPRAWHRALKPSQLPVRAISPAAHTLGHTWVTANEGIW